MNPISLIRALRYARGIYVFLWIVTILLMSWWTYAAFQGDLDAIPWIVVGLFFAYSLWWVRKWFLVAGLAILILRLVNWMLGK